MLPSPLPSFLHSHLPRLPFTLALVLAPPTSLNWKAQANGHSSSSPAAKAGARFGIGKKLQVTPTSAGSNALNSWDYKKALAAQKAKKAKAQDQILQVLDDTNSGTKNAPVKRPSKSKQQPVHDSGGAEEKGRHRDPKAQRTLMKRVSRRWRMSCLVDVGYGWVFRAWVDTGTSLSFFV
ncbi:hypothetical protein P7C70_g6110, partial [Phenoliferia sp. Uapishka_3]